MNLFSVYINKFKLLTTGKCLFLASEDIWIEDKPSTVWILLIDSGLKNLLETGLILLELSRENIAFIVSMLWTNAVLDLLLLSFGLNESLVTVLIWDKFHPALLQGGFTFLVVKDKNTQHYVYK